MKTIELKINPKLDWGVKNTKETITLQELKERLKNTSFREKVLVHYEVKNQMNNESNEGPLIFEMIFSPTHALSHLRNTSLAGEVKTVNFYTGDYAQEALEHLEAEQELRSNFESALFEGFFGLEEKDEHSPEEELEFATKYQTENRLSEEEIKSIPF